MKRFVITLVLFLSLPFAAGTAWLVFVLRSDSRSYAQGIAAPSGCEVLVCSDSQARDGIDPARFPGLLNLSASATTFDQNGLRLADVLSANPGRFRQVLIDVGVMQWSYDPVVPLSEMSAMRVHFPLCLRHRRELKRPLGDLAALFRDVLIVRKFDELRKCLFRNRPWGSASVGGFARKKRRGFVEPELREKAMEDLRRKADEVNATGSIGTDSPLFADLRDTVALVRASGAEPVLIVTPVSAPFLRSLRADLVSAFRASISEVAESEGVRLLDCLDWDLDERLWHDANHLNEEGAAEFTRRLYERFAVR